MHFHGHPIARPLHHAILRPFWPPGGEYPSYWPQCRSWPPSWPRFGDGPQSRPRFGDGPQSGPGFGHWPPSWPWSWEPPTCCWQLWYPGEVGPAGGQDRWDHLCSDYLPVNLCCPGIFKRMDLAGTPGPQALQCFANAAGLVLDIQPTGHQDGHWCLVEERCGKNS